MDDDRLSDLPDSLILSILSFLPITDLLTTSLLSKRWKHLWTTVSSLHLHHSPTADFDKFLTFVNRAFAHLTAPKFLKFTIDIHFNSYTSDSIDSILLFAIDRKVEELHLKAYTRILPSCFREAFQMTDLFYAPHPRLYSCSSLTKLTLIYVELSIGEGVRWDRLTSLTIEEAYSLPQHAMDMIISGAPLLEVLNLRVRESAEDLNIRSASLKRLKIVMCGLGSENDAAALRVLAPNLESLEISGISYTKCLFEVPSLTNAVVCFDGLDYFTLLEEMLRQIFLSICHVEKLSLTDSCAKVLLGMKKESFVLFSNVTFLKLYPPKADGMLDVVDAFPELMILIVEHNEFEITYLSTLVIILDFADFDVNDLQLMEAEFLMHKQLLKHDYEYATRTVLTNFFITIIPDTNTIIQQMQLNSLFQDEEPYVVEGDACSSLAPRTISPCLSLLRLKMIEITWNVRDASIIRVVEVLLRNAHMLEKMVLGLRMYGAKQEAFTLAQKKVLSIARSSPVADVIIRKC